MNFKKWMKWTISAVLLAAVVATPFFIFTNVVSAKNILSNVVSASDFNSSNNTISTLDIELKEQLNRELIKFKNKGVNLIKQYTISSDRIKWSSEYKFYPAFGDVFPTIGNKQDSVTISLDKKPINVKFSVLNDNQISMTIQKANLETKAIDAKTGEGLDNKSAFDFKEYFNKPWVHMGDRLAWDYTLQSGIPETNFLLESKNINILQSMKKQIQNIILSMNRISSTDSLWRFGLDGSSIGIFAIAEINFLPPLAYYYDELYPPNSRPPGVTKPVAIPNYDVDEENPFFDQILFQTKKDDTIKWVNFAFDVLNTEDKKQLLEGPDGVSGRDWNLSDLMHETMPSLLKWNENVKYLFEMENIATLVELFFEWQNTVATGSSWSPTIRDFLKDVINRKKFDSYDQLKKIYDNFYNLSITDPSNASTLNDFVKAKNELLKSNYDYSIKMNQVDNYLKLNRISKPSISIGTQLPNFTICSTHNQLWQPYQLLSYFLKGALVSNDIIGDIEADIGGTRKKLSKNQVLYSSNNNLINNGGLSSALVGTSVEEGGLIQNVNIKNIRIQNPLATRFFNLNSSDADASKFNKLNSQLKNIQIRYNPNALDLAGFNYENWTKNKDAIGLDINKYLTEIINFEDDGSKVKNDFINEDVHKMISEVINGEYSFLSAKNEIIKIPQPAWIYSGRSEYADYKGKLLDNVSSISQDNIDNLIVSQKVFTVEEWEKAWQVFKISLDAKDRKYPLWLPKQENGEFFVIGKINSLFTSSNYKTLVSNLIQNPKAPIILINREDSTINPAGDGYLLIKLKTCFNRTYDVDINNLRYYEVQKAVDPKRTIRQALEMFKTEILNAENKKYLINDKANKENNSFFTSESWTENNWGLNTNLIWKDMLSKDGVLLGNESVKKTAVNYFKSMVYKNLRPYMEKTFGVDSEEVKTFDYFIDNYEIYKSFINAINSPILISGMPYVFSNSLWNGLSAYLKYLEANAKVQFSQTEEQKTEAEKELNQNKFKKFLDSNEMNEQRLFTNDEITKMFIEINNIKQEVFDKATEDEYKDFLTSSFKKFQVNWNTNMTGGSINVGTSVNPEMLSFGNWKQDIENYLNSNDPSIIYQSQCQDLFLTNYDYYLKNVVNKLTFKVGSKINDNLVFSSLNELLDDQFVNLIFNKYKIDVDKAFKKIPYEVNGSIVENEYLYEINDEYNWPFTISTTYINNVKYYSLTSGKNDFSIDVDLNLLEEIANINFVDNKKTIYKVKENQIELKKSLSEISGDIKKQFDDWRKESQRKDNLKSEINIGSVLLVSLLPLAIIAVGLLLWWLLKTKKRKVEF